MAIKLRSSPRAALPAREFRYEAPAGKFGINSGVAAPMAYFPFNGWKESFFGILQGRDAVEFSPSLKSSSSAGLARKPASSSRMTNRRAGQQWHFYLLYRYRFV